MRQCPKCRREYFDETLNYCLEDGERLVDGAGIAERTTQIFSHDRNATPSRSSSKAETEILDPEIARDNEPLTTGYDAHGRTASRRKSIIAGIVGLALVTALGLGSYYYYRLGNAGSIDSLAVLPFENGTGDSSLDYLSDGLSESLIDKLSQLPGIKVIARSSSFKYRGPEMDVQEVANRLNVDALVMGKVSKVGDQFAIRLEVVDAAHNKQIWGEQYVRRKADLVSLQQDVAESMSEKLKLRLTNAQSEKPLRSETADPAAYDLYLRARHVAARGGNDNSKKGLELYLQAVETDPSFALAYSHIAHSYTVLADNAVFDPSEALPKAAEAARRAMELDDTLAESHMALGRLYRKRWNWQGAETELKRAIELNPNLSSARRNYGMYLSTMGRHDEAIREMAVGRELDPLSLGANTYLAYPFLFARRYYEGIEAAQKASQLDPKYPFAHYLLAYNFAAAGRHQEAIRSYEKVIELGDSSTGLQIYLGASYAALGERTRAMEILENLRKGKDYYSPSEFAILLAALDMKDEALASLEKAFANRDPQLEYLKVEPGFDPLRNDPRFADLVRRVGFPE